MSTILTKVPILRTIDHRIPSHRFILLLSLFSAFVYLGHMLLLGHILDTELCIEALSAGLTVFLTWGICREIDPDHPGSAVLSASLVSAIELILKVAQFPLVSMLLILLILRLVIGTLRQEVSRVGVGVIVALIVALPFSWGSLDFDFEIEYVTLGSILSLFYLLAIYFGRKVSAHSDKEGVRIDEKRLFLGRYIYWLIFFVMLLLTGNSFEIEFLLPVVIILVVESVWLQVFALKVS